MQRTLDADCERLVHWLEGGVIADARGDNESELGVNPDGKFWLGRLAPEELVAAQLGEAWLVPPPERQFDDPEEGKWMSARRNSHPLGCFTEPVYLSKPLEEFTFDRTYIKATLDPKSDVGADALWRAADRAKNSKAWRYVEIETTHMVSSNRPGELSAILLGCAGVEH